MNYEIIESVERCQEVVEELMTHHVISADAEGINLGRDGPLTLLQIGTRDGHVYLFDVQNDEDMFTDGGLKQLLESDTVLKVFHAASTDSLALKHQFDVSLNNIFDTQVADKILEEKNGRRLPPPLKLSDLGKKYCSVSMATKVHMKLKYKEKANYWGQRPFTEEMIEYACEAVRVLLPVMYDILKDMLEDAKAMPLFEERVVENTHYLNDNAIRQRRKDRYDDVTKSILCDMCTRRATSTESDDEDIVLTRWWTADEVKTEMNQHVQNLFYEKRMEVLKKIDAIMTEEGDDFCPTINNFKLLNNSKTYLQPYITRLATKMNDNMEAIAYTDMARKYSADTPLCHLGQLDKFLLAKIRIRRRKQEEDYPSTVLDLLYRFKEAKFKAFQRNVISDPSKIKITEAYWKYLSWEVKQTFTPHHVQAAAEELLDTLEKAGKRPQRTRRT